MTSLRSTSLAATWLLLLLQRTPALRLASTAAEFVAPTRIVSLLQATIAAAASLGAVQTVAGATQLVASPASPLTVATGSTVRVAMTVTGAQTAPASWTISGSVPPGLSFAGVTSGNINISTLILSGTPTTPGTYTISLRAWERINAGGDRSSLFPYTVIVTGATSTPPAISTQPASQSVNAGSSATLSVTASGSPAPTFQWRKDGVNLSGATAATLTLSNFQATDAGAYSVVVANSGGSVTSTSATLTFVSGVAATAITAAPESQHVFSGFNAAFTVRASGTALTYQWLKDGTAIPGATTATLNVPAATAANMGFYAARVTGGGTTLTSAAAILTVETGGSSRLVNVSTRGYVPAGGALTPGFVLQGNASKPVLIRAIGPTLGAFGLSGILADPVMDVIPLGRATAIASNDNWGGLAALASAFGRVGAFPLAASTSTDASVETNLPAAGATGYTVRITSKNTSAAGIALAEVYDEEGVGAPVRLVNVSTSGFVGTGDQALVPGFVIGGESPKQLLIRAVGPGLAQFGVEGTLPDPQLSIVPLGRDFTVATNDNWGGTAALQAAFTAAGAFALPAGSNDAAVVLRLPPGGYTVVVSGAGNSTGTALVEVYDLDP